MDIGLSILISILSGLVTGGLTCWFFYWLGGKDLKREIDDLRNLNSILIRGLHNEGILKVEFDKQGNRIGLKVEFAAGAVMRFTGSAAVQVGATVTPNP